MFRRSIIITQIICLLALIVFNASGIKFEDNAYKDLVVSVSPDIEEGQDGQLIINKIKVLICRHTLKKI